jgi:Secretion system C-terminal sorting domain
MKKLLLLSIIQLFVLTILSAQQTNYLRGVRYYYSTPSVGTFGTNLVCFKPEFIEESNGNYILSGYTNIGFFVRASTLGLNKFSNSIVWDYTQDEESYSHGISIASDDKVLIVGDNTENDSLEIVNIDSNGNSTAFSFHQTPVLRIIGFNRVQENINMASGHSYISNIAKATVLSFDNVGNILDTIVLSNPLINPSLIIQHSTGDKTLRYKNGYLTFGHLIRQLATNLPNEYSYCPSIWHWKNDSVLYAKEVFAGHNDLANDFCQQGLEYVDGNGREFVFTVRRTLGPNDATYNYLTFLDSNLNISWEHKIGTWPQPWVYDISGLKYDTDSNFIYVTGVVWNVNTDEQKSFLAKYRKNGTLIFFKYFSIGQSQISSITALTLLNDGDLLFAGRGMHNNGVRYFFTYRTGPDGYHEDGAYLGLEEVLASETEIGIFPNPSDGIFQVSSISTEPMQITMLDQQGKQVAQFELNELSSDNSFDLSDQAPGVYFAHISQGEIQWVKKLVVR